MGNAQSTGHAGHELAVSLHDPTRNLSDLGIPVPVGGYRSTPELRSELHEKIFGNTTVREIGSQDTLDEQPNVTRGALANILRFGDGHRVDVARLAILLEEFKNTASEEELIMLRTALLPADDADAGLGRPKANGDSPYSFEYRGQTVRRKSLYGPSPGTATRTKVAKLKKQPSSKVPRPPDLTQRWTCDDFRASPLSHIAGLKSTDAGSRASMPPQRPGTPLDLESANLGALKPGTLRVTNGIVTPEPSIRSGLTSFQPHPSPLTHDDYFTCSEGTDDGGASPGNGLTDDSKSTISVEASPTTPTMKPRFHASRLSQKPQTKITMSSIGSKRAVPLHHSDDVADGEAESSFALYSQEALANPFARNHGDDADDDSSIVDSSPIANLRESEDVPADMPETESIYSNAVQQLSPSTSVKQQRDRASTFEQLIGVSRTDSESWSAPRRLNNNANNDIPISRIADQIPSISESRDVRHLAPNVSSQPIAGRPVNQLLTHEYNSNRYYSAQGHQEGTVIPTKPAICSPSTSTDFGRSWQSQGSPVASPPSQVGKPSSFGMHGSDVASPNVSTPAQQSILAKSRSSADLLDLESPVIRLEGSASLPTSAEKTKKRNKLQKKRFSKQDPRDMIAAQTGEQPPVKNVPSIPVDIATNFSERLGKFPNMEHLDHTFDSVSTVGIRTHSPERPTAMSEIRFPSPAPNTDESPLSARGRKARRSSIGPGTSPSRLLQGLSRRNSKSRKVSDQYELVDGDIMGVQDFGTVPHLAGACPYEAVSKAYRRPASADAGSLCAPASEGPLRPRPTIGMDDKTASELAKWRSRDRLANARDVLARPTSVDGQWPAQRQIPQRTPLGTQRSEPDVPPLPSVLKELRMERPQSYAGPSFSDRLVKSAMAHRVTTANVPQSRDSIEPQNGSNVDSWRHGSEELATPVVQEVRQVLDAQAEFWRSRYEQEAKSRREDQSAEPSGYIQKRESPAAAPAPDAGPAYLERSAEATEGRLASPLSSAPRFEPPRLGARSPSPSVRERAALFERAEAQGGSPRAPPSPGRRQGAVQHTTAALLSSYETSGLAVEAQASSGAPVRLKDIMTSGGDERGAGRGKSGAEGGFLISRKALWDRS